MEGFLGRHSSQDDRDRVQASPQVTSNHDGLVCAPHETAGEKGEDKHQAVVQLSPRPGHTQLVKEPMYIEEGRGQFPQDEIATVVVDERSLQPKSVSSSRLSGWVPGKLTKPKE